MASGKELLYFLVGVLPQLLDLVDEARDELDKDFKEGGRH